MEKKRIVVFVGSARRRHTFAAAKRFAENLEALGDVEAEIVSLGDCRLESCRGCLSCFEHGEERCPLRDDRDILLAKIDAADGVVIATPNYSFQVSGLVKTFLDRMGFLFHRPRFHGKRFTALVAQGIYGGRGILKYLNFVAGGLGFNTTKGACLLTIEPVTAEAQRKNDESLARLAQRFHRSMAKPFPVPSLLALMVFRMSRTRIGTMLASGNLDFNYYEGRGWFSSDYYYPTSLGPAKKAVGGLVDLVAKGLV
jgi:multimeric flavodoxin WrbA